MPPSPSRTAVGFRLTFIASDPDAEGEAETSEDKNEHSFPMAAELSRRCFPPVTSSSVTGSPIPEGKPCLIPYLIRPLPPKAAAS